MGGFVIIILLFAWRWILAKVYWHIDGWRLTRTHAVLSTYMRGKVEEEAWRDSIRRILKVQTALKLCIIIRLDKFGN